MPRATSLAALAAVLIAAAAPAQQPIDTTSRPTVTMDGRLRAEIALISAVLGNVDVPAAERFRLGDQQVPTGGTEDGTVAVARGNLDVHGRIIGHAIVLHGDLIVHPGGSVAGNAVAVDGRVRMAGGVVDGDVRSVRGVAGGILARAAGHAEATDPLTPWSATKIVIGWFAILFAIGVGVLLFAEKNLDGVVGVLEQQFARAFWMGLLAQLAAIPGLLLLVLGLAITLIGILLIPFAVVAYVIALAGLVTLGFLAIARFTGRAFLRDAAASRAVSLQSLFVGLVIYVGLWLLAAIFVWNPVAGSVLRAIALAGSWVALTFGLGATILSRAGTRAELERARRPHPVDDLSWQTPTPVSGVVAARRPVATAKEGT